MNGEWAMVMIVIHHSYYCPFTIHHLRMALRVGLTGGIGSGKTIVAGVFEVLGIPVYYADYEAKRIMSEDERIKVRLITEFGGNAYINNQLNRSYIASVVFGNKQKLELLNSIVHPITLQDSNVWMQLQHTPYAIKEAALIFESGASNHLDFIIGVYAPLQLRIQRVITRDTIDTPEVYRRIENQMNEEDKMKLCDHVIVNDEQHPVINQVLNLHEKLVEMSLHRTR